MVFPDGRAYPCLLATGFLQRLRGLLGHGEDYLAGGVICLRPCCDIHTFGMRYPIDVAFLDSRGVVVLSRRGLPAARRLRCDGVAMVLERPEGASGWLAPGDEVRFL